jgi:hypothetical protein
MKEHEAILGLAALTLVFLMLGLAVVMVLV